MDDLRKWRSSNPTKVEMVRQRTQLDQSADSLLDRGQDRPRSSHRGLLDSNQDTSRSASYPMPTELIETHPQIRPDKELLTWEQRHTQRHDRTIACTSVFAAIFAAGSIATSAASIYIAQNSLQFTKAQAQWTQKISESQAASQKFGSYSANYGNQLQAASLMMQNKQLELSLAQAAKGGFITPDGKSAVGTPEQPGQPLEIYSIRNSMNPAITAGVDNSIGAVSNQVGHILPEAANGMYPPLFRKLKGTGYAKGAPSKPTVSTKNAQAAKKAVDTALRKYDCTNKACPTCKKPVHNGAQKPCRCLKQAQEAIDAYLTYGMSGQPVPEHKLARKMGPAR